MSGPWGSNFLIDDTTDGPVQLGQLDAKQFVLRSRIEFTGDMGLPAEKYAHITDSMKKDAAILVPGERSDLASVPPFMRWFANPYGEYTPAALIHDKLIVDEPNGGPLKDDAASDRFFRFMLESVGVPYFKRWIMWAAVALRTRWAVGGWRRIGLVAWVVLAAIGIWAFGVAAVSIVWDTATPGDIGAWALLGISVVMPFAAGALWGKQWGASLVAAIAAPWILPPTILAVLGTGIYLALEWVGKLVSGE
ncbi:MAG: DUF1353 domain-containing protein [Actinomycetota bacterium]